MTRSLQRKNITRILALSLLILAGLTACSSLQGTALGAALGIVPSATLTPTVTVTPSSTFTPTPTITPSPTPTRTPPALAGTFQTTLLKPLDLPRTYLQDTCQIIRDRWDPNNSAPGTVVMVIMVHSITDGEVTYNDQISQQNFQYLTSQLQQNGFTTITTEQLAGFLEHNEQIPPRSVMLIVDDRKRADYFNTHFKPLHDQFGWSVTNAWISNPDTPNYLWEENQQIAAQGWDDIQAHGVVHNIPIDPNSEEDFIHTEIYGSIEAIQAHFNVTPIAYIWPGGGFTQRGVDVAKEAGFQLGFTVNPRGPLLFNWIPLADEVDPKRPSYMPEGGISDPLMVLPRYWDTDAVVHIQEVISIGQQAADYYNQNRANDLLYYEIMCQPQMGPIPTLAP